MLHTFKKKKGGTKPTPGAVSVMGSLLLACNNQTFAPVPTFNEKTLNVTDKCAYK